MDWPFLPRLFTSKFACIGVIRGCPYFQLGLDRLVGLRSKTSLNTYLSFACALTLHDSKTESGNDDDERHSRDVEPLDSIFERIDLRSKLFAHLF